MNSTIEQTKQEMINVKNNQDALVDLNSTSKVSIWNLFLFIIAFCFQDLRKYFDAHRQDVLDSLNNQKSCTLPWYRTKAMEFQYGFDLITDSDKYDNTNSTEDEISAAKIIRYAAVNESEQIGRIIIKVAGEENDKLTPISDEQKTSLEAYFQEVKAAGDKITVINYLADKLFLNMKIFIDPLVLTQSGVSISSGSTPVEDAILEFMKELPFDGELILQSLIDKVQNVQGVKIAHLVSAQTSWLDPDSQTYGNPELIEVKRIPESGYFEVDNYENIEYVV